MGSIMIGNETCTISSRLFILLSMLIGLAPLQSILSQSLVKQVSVPSCFPTIGILLMAAIIGSTNKAPTQLFLPLSRLRVKKCTAAPADCCHQRLELPNLLRQPQDRPPLSNLYLKYFASRH